MHGFTWITRHLASEVSYVTGGVCLCPDRQWEVQMNAEISQK